MPAQTKTADSVAGRTVKADSVTGRTVYGETFSADGGSVDITDLLAYWNFNGGVADVDLGGDTGPHLWTTDGGSTYYMRFDQWSDLPGGPVTRPVVAGKFSEGYIVSGSASIYIVEDAAGTDYILSSVWDLYSSDFTISTWMKWPGAIASDKHLIRYVNGDGLRITIPSSSDILRLTRIIGGTPVDTDTGSILAADGNFHHVVIRRSGNNWTIWYDGTQEALVSSASEPGSAVGAQFFISQGCESFQFDDWAFWTRALTDDELANIYNGGTGRAIIA